MPNKKYVLGGGLAGLTFAHYCKDCEIIEKNDYLGGRVCSVMKEGTMIEWGAQFFSELDKYLLDLIKEVGLSEQVKKIPMKNFEIFDGNRFICLANEDTLDLDKKSKAEILKLHQSLSSISADIFDHPPKDLKDISFSKWYGKKIGNRTLPLINPIIRAISFNDASKQSAIYGIAVLEIFFNKCFDFAGGFTTLANLLKGQTSIRTNTNIEEIRVTKGQVSSIKISHDKKKEIIKIKPTELVVSSMPAPELAKVLKGSPELVKKLKKIKYGGCAHVAVKTKKRVLGKKLGVLFTDKKLIASAVFENNLKFDGEDSKLEKGLLSILIPYKKRIDQKNIDTAFKKMSKLFPLKENYISHETRYWDHGLPMCSKELFKTQEKIKRNVSKIKNFGICGDFMALPSIDAAIETGREIAARQSKN
ncbi:MAG: FAD-dependent oxidoreductase [Candidatus Diapherotrites archaeon]|nr:FAD-dependent oxidoreductase [Candidatus Diapherotrites archaeon]